MSITANELKQLLQDPEIKASLQKIAVPIGTILSYGGLVTGNSASRLASHGWLVCDGTSLSRDEYSELFAVIGDAFGAGDRINTFNLPDLRGRFPRGVDGGSGRDPDVNSRTASSDGGNTGGKVGSVQEDMYQQHGHQYLSANFSKENMKQNMILYGKISGDTQYHNTEPTGGSETRPKNIYVNYIIKFKEM